jgi:hypothetical protein
LRWEAVQVFVPKWLERRPGIHRSASRAGQWRASAAWVNSMLASWLGVAAYRPWARAGGTSVGGRCQAHYDASEAAVVAGAGGFWVTRQVGGEGGFGGDAGCDCDGQAGAFIPRTGACLVWQ